MESTLWTVVPYALFTVFGMILEAKVGLVGKVSAWFVEKVVGKLSGK